MRTPSKKTNNIETLNKDTTPETQGRLQLKRQLAGLEVGQQLEAVRPDKPVQFKGGVGSLLGDVAGGLVEGAWDTVANVGRGVAHTVEHLNPFDDVTVGDHLTRDTRVLELLQNVAENHEIVYDFTNITIQTLIVTRLADEAVVGAAKLAFTPERVAKMMGKKFAKTVLQKLATRAIMKLAVKLGANAALGASGTVSLGVGAAIGGLGAAGVIRDSVKGSDRLKADFPELHTKLEPNKLDLLWFLVEDQIPWLIQQIDGAIYQEIRDLAQAQGDDETAVLAGDSPERSLEGAAVNTAPVGESDATPQPIQMTRGDFLAMLAPAEVVGQDAVMAWAKEQGLVMQGQPEAQLNRAEATTMLVRYLGLDGEKFEEEVHFFHDVPPGEWYFRFAHIARLYGVFTGGQDNRFMPTGAVDRATALLLIQRTRQASKRSKEEQGAHLTVTSLSEPSTLEALLCKERLSSTEIGQARELIAQLPPEQQVDYHRRLASKGQARNQRNNIGKHVTPDWMCNMTSLAMVLEALGVENDAPEKQFEDALDEELFAMRGGMARYSGAGQAAIAAKYGVQGERLGVGGKGPQQLRGWFLGTVLPRLQAGEVATLSIQAYGPGHIVRLQWVEEEGIIVDDPFGQVKTTAGRFSGYDLNGKGTEASKGEDNLWQWGFLAPEIKYVHFWWR